MARAPSKDKDIKAKLPADQGLEIQDEAFSAWTAKISSKKIN